LASANLLTITLGSKYSATVGVYGIADLLLSLLKYRLKKIKISPQAALREVETMYKVYLRDSKKGFTLSRVVTLTKKQERIFRAINKKLLKS